jgi:asparagine synthase (glutamine-hydrolysing)
VERIAGEFDFRLRQLTHAASADVAQSRDGASLAWDGRLDNRDDLPLTHVVNDPHRGDAALALAMLEARGPAGLHALIGDWSLAAGDPSRHTLHLARDYMGARPLYYCRNGQGVAWSSDLGALVARCRRQAALSDAFAAHFMSLRPAPGLTPYDDVHAVPTGSCISVGAGGDPITTRFWNVTAGDVRYRDPRCYEEQLRSLWREAVGSRLRTDGTVWAELSGGLDSSSVVCMADRLIRGGGVAARALRLVSHVTLESPEGDERRFIADVERQVGVRSEIVGVEANQAHSDPARAWITPYALQGVGLETVRRVRAAGGRVVLSGRLGDAIMGCQPDNSEAVFDDLADGHVLAALRNLRAWSRATHKPFVELAWRVFAPEPPRPDTGGALLTHALRERLGDTDGDVTTTLRLNGIRPAKRSLARMVLAYARGGRLDIPHYPPDILYTYPFAHRPLVEFVLAIPGEELSAPGVLRSLMRRAFAGLLPPRILNRQSKGYYPPAMFRAARQQIAAMVAVERLEVVERGWIDADRLRAALRTLADGGGETGGDIHLVLRLERWLQARSERAAIPQRKEVNDHAVLNA